MVIDWKDTRPIVAVSRVAGLMGVGWRVAQRWMAEGQIKSVKSGKSWRTSWKNLRAFMDGEPQEGGES